MVLTKTLLVKYLSLRSFSKATALTPLQKGFSLVELLIVIGIVSLLSALAMPAFNSLASSRGVTQGLYDISTLLEFGRTEAVTRQTYVWVVFQNASVGNQSTQSEVRMAVFASQDGTATATASNLLSLTKVMHVRNVTLTSWTDLKAATTSLLSTYIPVSPAPVPSDIFANTSAVSFLPAGATGRQYTVTFTPRGEAMRAQAPSPYTPYDSWIDLSFRQINGYSASADTSPTSDGTSVDDAAVIIDGTTGTLQRIRLQ